MPEPLRGRKTAMLHRTVLLILLFPLTGCYKYTSVEIHVFDAQTRRPLQGIRFDLNCESFLDPFSPKSGSAMSNAEGIAEATVCTNYKSGYEDLFVGVDGYLLDQPMPSDVYRLRPEQLRAHGGERMHIDIGMLTYEEYRLRYMRNGISPD
jgi:hypothetical protein